jgi:hypothetical protein
VVGTTEHRENRPYKAIVTTVYDKTGDGGIVYAIAQNCYLVGNQYDFFCGRPKYHFSSDEIASAFDVSKGSISTKAKAIREDLGITNDNNEWLPPNMREMNTMVNSIRRAIGIND